jgi:AbrB family looped-hinge helix DNA binding protein
MRRRSRPSLNALASRVVTLSSKGQFTLPIAVRRRWGLGPGDRVTLAVRAGGIAVRPLRRSIVAQTAGSLQRFVPQDKREEVTRR